MNGYSPHKTSITVMSSFVKSEAAESDSGVPNSNNATGRSHTDPKLEIYHNKSRSGYKRKFLSFQCLASSQVDAHRKNAGL